MTTTLTNFGAELAPDTAIHLLEHVFQTNLKNEEDYATKNPNGNGKRPTPDLHLGIPRHWQNCFSQGFSQKTWLEISILRSSAI